MPLIADTNQTAYSKSSGRLVPSDDNSSAQEPRASLDWTAIEESAGAGALGGVVIGGMGTGTPMGAGAGGLEGLISGGVSEFAGQMAEKKGASPLWAETARIGSSLVPPSLVGNAVLKGANKATFGVAGDLFKAAQKYAGRDAETKIGEQVKIMQRAMRGGDISNIPQTKFFEMLNQNIDKENARVAQEAQAELAKAQAEAEKLRATRPQVAHDMLEKARAKAQHEIYTAEQNAKQLKEMAANYKAQSAQITKENAGELEKVGTRFKAPGEKVEHADIGKELQDPIVKGHEQALKDRAAEYNKKLETRNEIIAEKYEKGEKISNNPKFKELISNLKARLGESGKGEAQMTDPAQRAAMERLVKALEGTDAETGKLIAGEYDQLKPETKKLAPDFDAIDYIRRKMGKVAFGKPAEGFDAIDQHFAKELYAKLNDIQGEFVGNIQSEMQGEYAQLSREINTKYKAGAGKKLTVLDRYSNENLADTQDIPSLLFKSPESVRDAVELTKNKDVVAKAGSKYLSSLLEGKSADQVMAFLDNPKNSGWISELSKIDPSLKPRLQGYKEQLIKREADSAAFLAKHTSYIKKAEGITDVDPSTLLPKHVASAREGVKQVAAGPLKQELKGLESHAAQLEKDALATHNEKLATQQQEVAKILRSGTPDVDLKKVLLGESPDADLKRMAKYMGQSEDGRKLMAESVRQIVSRESPKSMEEIWNTRLKSALESSGVMSKEHIEALDRDIVDISKITQGMPKKVSINIKQKLLKQALIGYSGSVAGRTIRAFTRKDEE